jgi:serine phosphatase RsbU (regulator of sigma subunit)
VHRASTGCFVVAAQTLPTDPVTGETGDWTDVLTLPGGDLAFIVGDACGKGAQAAPLKRTLQAAVRQEARWGASPAGIVARLRRILDAFEDALATLVLVVVGQTPGRVALITVGHPPALVLRCDGSASFVGTSASPPLGAPCLGNGCAGAEADLRLGDTIVLYTDGVIEGPGRGVEEGMVRLSDQARRLGPGAPVEELCRQLIQLGLDGSGVTDDLTVLAIRRSAPPT